MIDADQTHSDQSAVEGLCERLDDFNARLGSLMGNQSGLSASETVTAVVLLASLHADNIREAAALIRSQAERIAGLEGEGWQDIATAPLEWESILVWAYGESERDEAEDEEREPIRSAMVAQHSDIQPGLWWLAGTMQRVFEPTHWMPLPAPPARAALDGREGVR